MNLEELKQITDIIVQLGNWIDQSALVALAYWKFLESKKLRKFKD